jgi:hypothetical protein
MDNKFFIPDNVTGIVIKLSGGADSSILYYGLCKHIVENNLSIPIYVTSMDTNRKPWYSHYAKKVINFTKQETGISPVEHRIHFLDGNWTMDDYVQTQHDLMMSVIDDKLANVAYSGLTQNPTRKDLHRTRKHKDFNKNGLKYLDENLNGTDSSRNDHSNKKVVNYNGHFIMINPFIHKTKKEVFNWYKHYNVLDTLFPLTYSCEESDNEYKKLIKVEDGFAEMSHCGFCWFCMERIYAFGRLV